jgi:hypothetical protein
MKPRVVIVGAGLGGCFAAHGLADTHDVTIVELDAPAATLYGRVRDVGAPAITEPHIGNGLGGTTELWHNGLIQIDAEIFERAWPFPKDELDPYYERAYPPLAGVPIELVDGAVRTLREKYLSVGLPDLKLPGLFYPRARRNAWDVLELERRLRLVRGEAVGFEHDGARITHVLVRSRDGAQRLEGDAFILAAGGLGTPLLLQRLAQTLPLPSLANAGRFYEDHPMGFVGEMTMRAPLYRFWNYDAPGSGGNLRMPLVVEQDGLHVSFQIRPAANFYRTGRLKRVHSIVTDIRNNRLNPVNYFRLLTHWDDVLDILSFRFGIRLPTTRYSLLMVAQQPASEGRAISEGTDPRTGQPTIQRDWELTPGYLETLEKAIGQVLGRLDGIATKVGIFPDWRTLESAAHHSGTARMATSASDGVCDADARVHGLQNLYVADGSVIPGCGIANTGLTIAALALRLANHLRTTALPATS